MILLHQNVTYEVTGNHIGGIGMRKSYMKKLALVLTLVLIITTMLDHGAVAMAATPTFAKKSIAITGAGNTDQQDIKNKVSGSKYKWSSSKTSVAKVNSKGLITAVNKGSAVIKCKITYPNGKTLTLSSKVTVTIPATEIKINNAKLTNGAHVLLVGEKYDFNRDIVPKNSSDKTYWSLGKGDAGTIVIDNKTNGKITAKKPGKIILIATAAKTATENDAKKSIINDAIIIEVIRPSATVRSAEIINSTEIKVVFDSSIDKNTIIGANNALLDSIEVTMRKDTKGVLANDPGKLTASLAADLRTLTITSTNMLTGEYGISFTNKIKTTDGVAIEEYYKQISFIDTIPPSIVGVALDDSGMIATIKFSEPVDFTKLRVSNASLVPGGSNNTVEQSTLSILNNRLNYVPSEDKKALSINLSKIATTDYGKTFSVVFTGIVDMSGNSPANYTLTAYLLTDNTPKPQARPLAVIRTAYNTVTAIFDRAISSPGMASVNGGSYIAGVIDANDTKKVNFTITEANAALNGIQKVSIGFWNSFNVIPTDITSQRMTEFNVNFTIDRTSPVLTSYEFDIPSSTLTLNYNKEVVLTFASGIFNTTLVTINDDIRSGTNISYTQILSTDKKVIKLKMSNMTLVGNYTFTLDQGFVKDSFRNDSLSRSLTISNIGDKENKLPRPYVISQSTTNLSHIYVEFADKIDIASAQNINNYSIPGVTIISAQVTKNTSDNGSTVLLTVADESIAVTVERPITISGIKGYNGSFDVMEPYTTTIELKDNKKPIYLEPVVYDKTAKNIIRLNFNEAIKGTMLVKVTQLGGVVPREFTATVSVVGNSVVITLDSIPENNTYLRIDVLDNKITDVNGNQSTIPTTLGVLATY